MQKNVRCVVLAAFVTALPLPALAGELQLTLANGRATVIADDVPLRQIFAEWARVGRTTIVNADKLVGPSVTLQLIDVPEAQALDALLRSASGYVVAQRAAVMPGASLYDRILIMPTSRPPAASASAPPPAFNQPARPMPQPVADDDEPADAPVVMPPGMSPGPPTQLLNAPGMQPPVNGQPSGQPMTAPRPGMLPTPPGAQPQPNPYGTTPTVIRPPGGPGGGPGGPGGTDR